MTELEGQILPDSRFGKLLTALTKETKTIVEIGCWRGGGSTKCISLGLVHPDQQVWAIDADRDCLNKCRYYYKKEPRIMFRQGTICNEKLLLPKLEDPTTWPYWESDRAIVVKRLPLIDLLPPEIGLLLLDGGDYSTHGDFELLHPRSHFIALDDTNTVKNKIVRQRCLDVGWRVLADHPDERNGWFVCERIP
jgi:hypothetical protein